MRSWVIDMNEQDTARLRKALAAIVRLKEELAAERARSHEPIAIVSMSCRFPGDVDSPESFARLLAEGRDGTSEVPAERWDAEAIYSADPSAPGTSYCRRGGFLLGTDRFDAPFFGIAPREARSVDPQQRLLLELSWELVERAGLTQEDLLKTQTGVFVGVMYNDYSARVVDRLEDLDGYVGTGNAASVAAGRVSYVLGLEGPSVALDTACSSSLVALHLACQALRAGECDRALAGGVTLMQLPTTFVEFSMLRGIAADGRCKSFGGGADGVGWGEGCGLLLLRRLGDAQRDGDEILGLIRGSAVNQDGRSQGLTAPNGPSQERVVRSALAAAGLEAHDIDYIEGHGTGTALGDPIEARALDQVFRPGRPPERPLYLGSVKSNIGHAQAAAGVAGVMKTVLALRAQQIFPTLHAGEGSPHVDWSASPLRLAHRPVEWALGERRRRAGVSAFGIGGTNAHVVVEEAPERKTARADPELHGLPILLSAKSEPALRDAAGRWAAWLSARPSTSLLDLAYTAAARRTHFEVRASVAADSREEVIAALGALAEGRAHRAVTFAAAPRLGRLAMLFTGQGSQRAQMGAALAAHYPTFRTALEEVARAIDPHLGRSLLDLLRASPGSVEAALLEQTAYAQPALFALEVALFRLWESFGVRADALLGHSVGEISAAHVAGVFTLEDAARFVVARGRAMQACRSDGAMLSVQCSEEALRPELSSQADQLAIAAINGPEQVVVSGDEAALLRLAAALEPRGIRVKRLPVSHAFHSSHMDAALEPLRSVLAACQLEAPRRALISNLHGARLTDSEAQSPERWIQHLRDPVRFFEGLTRLRIGEGVDTYLECGPDAVLSGLGAGADEGGLFIPSLRRDQNELLSLHRALAELHLAGVPLAWRAVFQGRGAQLLADLPTYAFQRRRHWFEAGPGPVLSAVSGTGHALLGAGGAIADSTWTAFSSSISSSAPPWVREHRVGAELLLPGAAMLEMMHAAAACSGPGAALGGVVFSVPLVIPERGERRVQVTLDRSSGRARIYSQEPGGETWTPHAEGQLLATAAEPTAQPLPPRGAAEVPLDIAALYEELAARGLRYGRSFQALRGAWIVRDPELTLWAELVLPEEVASSASHYGLHPALLDAALQSVAIVMQVGDPTSEGSQYLPFAVQRFDLWRAGAASLWAQIRLESRSEELLRAAITLFDPQGLAVGRLEGLELRRVSAIAPPRAPQVEQLAFQLGWDRVEAPVGVPRRLGLLAAGAFSPPTTGPGALPRVERQEDAAGLDGLVVVWESDPGEETSAAAHRMARQGLAQLQAAVRSPGAPLIWVTRGALSTKPSEAPCLAPSVLVGLARSARNERPELRLSLVDVPVDARPEDWEGWLSRLPAGEPELALRDGQLWAPRLVRASASTASTADLEHGTTLLTGGFGALGREVARWLVRDQRVRQLLITSRRGLSTEDDRSLVQELSDQGATVTVASVDAADRSALAALLLAIPRAHPLVGVVHTAGVLDDGLLDALTEERLARVLKPKVDGAWNLHTLTQGQDLRLFVVFSSAAGILGAPGQGNYAAANAFLDALAQHRRAAGLPGLSIAWGPWAGRGMAAQLGAVERVRLERQGFRALRPEQGLALLAKAVAQPSPLMIAMDLDAAGLQRAVDASGVMVPPLYRRLLRAPASAATSLVLRQRLLALDPPHRLEPLLEAVRAEVAHALGLASKDDVKPSDAFRDLGIDSLSAVQLRNRLATLTGTSLPAAVVFEHPSALAMTEVLLEQLQGALPAPPREAEPVQGPKVPPVRLSRSLLDRFAAGKLPPVDAATFVTVPDGGLQTLGLDREYVREQLMEGLPTWGLCFDTQLGRIAGIMLPVFSSEVYRERERLLEAAVDGLELAGRIGAKVVSLTALLPSALEYGVALVRRVEGRPGLPRITTGHATTTAAICLNIAELLQRAGRRLERERLGVLGVGSIGTNVLRLMLRVLPHPASIRLCDLYAKRATLEEVARELRDEHGYTGAIELLSGDSGPPAAFYASSLILGATNVPDVLDLTQVAPATLLLDDSFPHCFPVDQAIARLERAADILFTEAGPVRARQPIPRIASIPTLGVPQRSLEALTRESPELQGCMFSSILSARYPELVPTVGAIQVEQSRQHYERLKELGFSGTELQCDGYLLPAAQVAAFRARYSDRSRAPNR